MKRNLLFLAVRWALISACVVTASMPVVAYSQIIPGITAGLTFAPNGNFGLLWTPEQVLLKDPDVANLTVGEVTAGGASINDVQGIVFAPNGSCGLLWTPEQVFLKDPDVANLTVGEVTAGGASLNNVQGIVYNPFGGLYGLIWTPDQVFLKDPNVANLTVSEVTAGGASINNAQGIAFAPNGSFGLLWTPDQMFLKDPDVANLTVGEVTVGGASLNNVQGIVYNPIDGLYGLIWTPDHVFLKDPNVANLTVGEVTAGGASINDVQGIVFAPNGTCGLIWTPDHVFLKDPNVANLNVSEVTAGGASIDNVQGIVYNPFGGLYGLIWTPDQVFLKDPNVGNLTVEEVTAGGASINNVQGIVFAPNGSFGLLWTPDQVFLKDPDVANLTVGEVTAGGASINDVQGIAFDPFHGLYGLIWTPDQVFLKDPNVANLTVGEVTAEGASIDNVQGIVHNPFGGLYGLIWTPDRIFLKDPDVADLTVSEVTTGGASIFSYDPTQASIIQVVIHQLRNSGAGVVGIPAFTPTTYTGSATGATIVPISALPSSHSTVLGAAQRVNTSMILGPNPVSGVLAGNSMRLFAFVDEPECPCSLTYTFTGGASQEYLGHSVSGAGDVNWDGFDDLIVGAWGRDTVAGGVDVYSGRTGALLHTFTGEATADYLGYSVSGAGDVNKDGFDDLIVAAPWNDAGGDMAGRAYVFSGSDGDTLYIFTGQAEDRLGFSVSGAGDVDHDGFADLIVGAPFNDAGRAYVYSGRTGALRHTFTGEAADDGFGFSVSGAGDVDNDGFADLIVGAHRNDAGGTSAGRAYVHSGQTGALLWTFTGEADSNLFGFSVSGAGDVNNDGFADLIVGALRNHAGGTWAGRAYVFSGSDGDTLYIFTGEAAYSNLGESVSGAGDVDNDGFADLIVGASGNGAGRAYLYSGQTGALLGTFEGEAATDNFGASVSGAGDVNRNGLADLIVGAEYNDAGGTSAGRAYVYTCGEGVTIPPPSPGDPNGDGEINIGDAVYLVNYLFMHGPKPVTLEAGDPSCDTAVDIADCVYTVNYLFGDGPAPCEGKATIPPGSRSEPYKGKNPIQIGLSSPTISKDGVFEVPVMGKFGVDLAAVQLEIKYDPEEITLLEPALTSRTQNLTIYSYSDEGIYKIGLLDLNGEHFISTGDGALVNLRIKGPDLSSRFASLTAGLEITEAILVDRDAQKIPVEIVSKMEESEDNLTEEQPAVPQEFSLSQNYPNPFNPETEISYALPTDCHVKLSIYNIAGRKVKTLIDQHQTAGYKTIAWNGKNDKGKELATGVYFYRIQAGDFRQSRKMVLVK